MPARKHFHHPEQFPCEKPEKVGKDHDIAVVERVLHKSEECARFEGELTLCNLCPSLRFPLRLCSVDVVGIFPLRSHSVCFEDDCIRLLLRCRLVDSCGREGTASAQIHVQTRPLSCCAAGGMVRRGAAVDIAHSALFYHHSAHVCLSIRLLTLVTGIPRLSCTKACSCGKPPLPLYPRICLPERH